MSQQRFERLQAFQWSRQPAAEILIRDLLEDFLKRNDFAAHLARRMTDETGTRFFDWIDSISLPGTAQSVGRLHEVGYVRERPGVLHNPQGIFPRVRMAKSLDTEIAIKVDSVADFLAINQLECPIEGEPFAPLRRATVAQGTDASLTIVERRGSDGIAMTGANAAQRLRAIEHFELFRCRLRSFNDGTQGFAHANQLADAAIADLGPDQTCALFFLAEREFWQRRNRAAQVQKARQDRLGLGWGNHDHHTYRSSRACFRDLIAFFEKLGCVCRERFYAGREAGWGAQVMENPRAGIITFNDVDLAPEELIEDFAHQPLAPRDTLGTVGLWCALHGEAFLQAGMHHLECQFDFAALKQQLERDHAITVMKPFTDYPYLRQAFTEGERWPVAEERLQRLLNLRQITPAQADQFRQHGAIGSHLENLERNEGFKGFNQKGVNEIIAATDPRKQAAPAMPPDSGR